MNLQPVRQAGAAARLVSVILPTYNESGNIVPLVREILQTLAPVPVEILVVDDNSPDGTADCVRNAFDDDPAVRLIVRTTDPSFAKSIRTGIDNACGDVIIVMDSDFNHQPKYLPFMIEGMRHFDCVMGSRFVYGGKMFPRSRHLASWLFNVFVRCATWGEITDNLYGYFAVRADLLRRCNFDEIFHGFGEYFIRLIYQFQKMELDILQFPAINGERRKGVGNRTFFRTFRIYFFATWRLVFRKGRLNNGHNDSSVPYLRQPATGTDSEPGRPGVHRHLPEAGSTDRRRSA
jgi:dolichol-phosphate mannosyltransferase